MNNTEMEQRLAEALKKTAPNDVDGVLSRCEERTGTEKKMTKTTTNRRWISLAAACLAVVLLVSGGLVFRQENAVASVVSLDVNPSIELNVNKREKVLSCRALNEDARKLLEDMNGGADLEGVKLEVAVNAIVGSLVRSGYLSSISSAIMISVEDRDAARAEKLQRELMNAVDGILQTSQSQASVLTQTVAQDAALEQQARENRISTGKAALIKRIIAMNDRLSFEALATLSVGELKDLAEAGAPGMPIGRNRAMEIAAAEYGKISQDGDAHGEVDAELDENPAHYEVEFKSQNGEDVEYKIDAYTGAILEVKREAPDEDEKPAAPSDKPAAADVGYDGAKAAALRHAGLTEDRIHDMDIEPEMEDGGLVYEIEFKSGGMEYEYVIDAVSGAVLEYEIERED